MKKRVYLFILILILIAVHAAAADAPAELNNSEGFVYIIKEDGTAEITGYTGPGEKISIPGELDGVPVTSIGESAFAGKVGLTSVTIPEGVTSVGNLAFSLCVGLTEVYMPDSLVSLGDFVFAGCGKLVSVRIPESLESIGNYAFTQCTSLAEVIVPESVGFIGEGAFESSTEVHFIEVSAPEPTDAPTEMPAPAPAAESGEKKSLVSRLWSALTGGDEKTEAAPTDTPEPTEVPTAAPTAVPADASKDEEEKKSFGSRLWSALTGKDQESEEEAVPADTSESSEERWPSEPDPEWTALEKFVFEQTGDGTCRITGYTGDDAEISIPGLGPDGCRVTEIGKKVFSWNKNLTSVIIPQGIESIGNQAFSQCTHMVSVVIPEGVRSIGDLAFSQCTALTAITIPDSVESIGANAFTGCRSLTSVNIPETLTSIAENAFDAPKEPEKTVPRVGDTVTFGHYEQDNDRSNGPEPIEWKVLSVDNGTALMMSIYLLDIQPYHKESRSWVSWEESSLRAWLNRDFYGKAFDASEQRLIIPETLKNPDDSYQDRTENDTKDSVFLLSINELMRYIHGADLSGLPTEYAKAVRETKLSGLYDAWWLRSSYRSVSGSPETDGAYFVSDQKSMTTNPILRKKGIRPVIRLDLDGYLEAASAAEKQAEQKVTGPVSQTELYRVGDIFTFGHYEQDNDRSNGPEPIEWQVLDVKGDRALVISKYGLDAKPYNEFNTLDITWETCTLRSWLNGEFFNTAFSTEEKGRILKVINENPGAAEDNMDAPNRGTKDENPTEDMVFLLHVNEVEQYRDLLKSDCHATEYAKSNGAEETDRGGEILSPNWWSRSRAGDLGTIAESNFYSYLNYSFAGYKDKLSSFITSITNPRIAVRPVFWLNLSNETESIPDNDMETAATEQDPAPLAETGKLKPGDIFTFGSYEQDNDNSNGAEPIEWQVLAVEGERVLAISRSILDERPYNQTATRVTWETCSLRSWLNGEFLRSAFTPSEQALIVQVTNRNPYHPYFKVRGGNNTQDRVFLLSIDEAERYFDSDPARITGKTKYADSIKKNERFSWWLRSPGAGYDMASQVMSNGMIYGAEQPAVVNNIHGVRPAVWLEPGRSAGDVSDYSYVINVSGDAGALLRTEASNSGAVIRVVLNGTQVERLDGKTSDGREWARIRLDNGAEGWVTGSSLDIIAVPGAAAASDKAEPGEDDPDVSASAAASPAAGDPGQASDRKDVMQVGNCHTPTRLKIGDTVQLGDSSGLQMYMSAYGKPYDGWVVFPGKTAKVTDGPKCEDGSVWWEVDFLGYRGWVRENNSSGDYYLEKVK